MKKKISKFAILFCLPVVAFLTLAIFFMNGFVGGFVSATNGDGGAFYVGTKANMEVSAGIRVSGSSAVNGGGVYNNGTLTLTGGTISGNTATSGNGHNIYNNGTFTMTNGIVGTSGSPKSFGIYNTGTMNLYGGTVYDNIYSSTSFNTKVGASINGQITLSDSAIINVKDYAGTTPNYTIKLPSSRTNATILTFTGSTIQPNLENITVLGDLGSLTLKAEQSETDEKLWIVKLVCTLTINKEAGVSSFSVKVNGTTTSYASQYSKVLDYGTSVDIGITPATGYNGGYWCYQSGSILSSEASTSVMLKSDTTLKAYATPGIYTITLNDQSATTTGTATIYEKYATGYYSNSTATTSITSITIPTRTGYTFGGYYTSTGGSGTQIINSSGSIVASNTKFTAGATIYAKWTIATYTITFNKSGGTGGTDSVTVKYGESLPTISIPSRTCYNFKGYYYITLKSSTQYYTANGTSSKTCDFTSDITLYAEWKESDATYERDGDYVYFGSYPQSLGIIPSNAIVSTSGDTYTYNGNTYKKVGDNYYKYEKIKWRIIYENGYDLILIADQILDTSQFNSTALRDGTYENFYYYYGSTTEETQRSTLYTFMNTFASTLFTGDRKNFKNPFYKDEGWILSYYTMSGELVVDKTSVSLNYDISVIAPSYDDFLNSKYKLSSSSDRARTATDYAKACGCGDDSWWTMTAYVPSMSHSNLGVDAFWVDKNGTVCWNTSDLHLGIYYPSYITNTKGVVPMMRINTSKLLSCGHAYDKSKTVSQIVENTDGTNGHHTETTYYCSESECSNTKTVTSNNVLHDSLETGTYYQSTTYTYANTTQHNKINHFSCSTCGATWMSSSRWAHSGSTTYPSYTESSHTTSLYCSICKKTITGSGSHTLSVSGTSYVSDGDDGHHLQTTKKCACGYSTTVDGDTVAHTLTTETSSAWSFNTLKHWKSTKTTCSYCDYSTTGTANSGRHSFNTDNMCTTCFYQKISSLPVTFASMSECEDCMTEAVNNQNILLDDKKSKTDKLLYFNEKRYLSTAYEAKNFQI